MFKRIKEAKYNYGITAGNIITAGMNLAQYMMMWDITKFSLPPVLKDLYKTFLAQPFMGRTEQHSTASVNRCLCQLFQFLLTGTLNSPVSL